MTAPRLSVIVPTYNRRQRLGRVLQALGSQAVSPEIFEVVVVDDGSTDGTRTWLAEQRFAFELRALSQANAGPAVARNTGIRAAGGELLVFLDDDVVPTRDWLGEHVRTHDASPGDIVVLGPLSSLPRYDQPWIAWEQVQVEKQYAAMGRGDWEPTYRQFWTGNASVSRARVLEAGLFDAECLRGEDVELGWRLAQNGVGFRFNPRAQGFHHAERSLESFCRAHESYGRLEVELFGRTSRDEAWTTLAGNLGRLHPAQRLLLLQAVARPWMGAELERALRATLSSPLATDWTLLTNPACSLLANLLYWRSAAAALGPEEFREVTRRAQTGKVGPTMSGARSRAVDGAVDGVVEGERS